MAVTMAMIIVIVEIVMIIGVTRINLALAQACESERGSDPHVNRGEYELADTGGGRLI